MADYARLNLGAGVNTGIGWTNLDQNYNPGPTVGDASVFVGADFDEPLPFPHESFNGIVMNHSLQCLPTMRIVPCLRECRRVLRAGGVLRVLVPDVLAAFHAYEGGDLGSGDPSWPGFAAIEEDWDIDRKFGHYLTWGGQNRSCFTEWSLEEWMSAAGFTHTGRCSVLSNGTCPTSGPEWMTELDSRLGESIVVEGWWR